MKTLPVKTLLCFLLTLYILVMILAFTDTYSSLIQTQRELHSSHFVYNEDDPNDNNAPQDMVYRFSDPILAYKIFIQLDVLAPPTHTTENIVPFLNLRTDNDYCNKHRRYISEYPETIFQQINFITNGSPSNFVRNKVLTPIGDDVQPYVGAHIPRSSIFLTDIKPEVNLFFTRSDLYESKKLNRHFSCITQMSNHAMGNSVLGLKDRFAEEVKEYAKRYASRPECFNLDKYYPRSYLLYRKQECLDFFKAFNSPEYEAKKQEQGIVYIRKLEANLHTGEGVEPVKEKQEAELREMYSNGIKCGQNNDRYIVQTFIHNPLLLNGRKFDFRIYLMLASVNPLIAHYHDGFLRVSLLPYDVRSDDKKVLLTNLGLNYHIYGEAREGNLYEGMDEEGLKHAQQWSYDRLQAYLLANGIIDDPNWLDNYLRPGFKRALVHLLRFGLKDMYPHSSLFQLYGVDFMLDNNLNLWFIEANSAPGLGEYSKSIDKLIARMLQDHIKVATALMRSRMKRIVGYINSIIVDGSYETREKGEIIVRDLEHKRMVFQRITKNKFEKEFEPDVSNGFKKIIDENYEGVERYQGLLKLECL